MARRYTARRTAVVLDVRRARILDAVLFAYDIAMSFSHAGLALDSPIVLRPWHR
jgi:hypothetical protein